MPSIFQKKEEPVVQQQPKEAPEVDMTPVALIAKLQADVQRQQQLANQYLEEAKQCLTEKNEKMAQFYLTQKANAEKQMNMANNSLLTLMNTQATLSGVTTAEEVARTQEKIMAKLPDPSELLEKQQDTMMKQEEVNMAMDEYNQQLEVMAYNPGLQEGVSNDLAALKAEMAGEQPIEQPVLEQTMEQPQQVEEDLNGLF